MTSSSVADWIVSSLDNDKDNDKDNDNDNGDFGTSSNSNSIPIPTHLFLHLDINETILLGDDAGGDSRNESTHKMLAKSAFCRIPEQPNSKKTKRNDENENENKDNRNSWDNTRALEPTHWWDGQEIGRETSVPKLYTGFRWPDKCCPYYRTAYKKHAKSFCSEGNHGRIYRPVLEACEAALATPSAVSSGTTGTWDHSGGGGGGAKENTMLPAFYETLRHLIKSHQNAGQNETFGNESESPSRSPSKSPSKLPFTVVFRTFGSDLPEIAKVVTTFAMGEHPGYPGVHFPPLCLPPERLYQGRWKIVEDDNDDNRLKKPPTVVYQLWNYHDETQLVASGDAEILKLLGSSGSAVFGIRDDYRYWKKQNWNPTAGKPVWVPEYPSCPGGDNDNKNNNLSDSECDSDSDNHSKDRDGECYAHHLLFDDNIHNLPNDGIACVRTQVDSESKVGPLLFDSVHGSDLGDYQGVHLVRVPTVEPVLNPHWYIQQIESAGKRLQDRLLSQSQSQSR